MITTDKIQNLFYEKLRIENEEKEKKHTQSGKLSAGKLHLPTRLQLMYTYGVPTKKVEDYALGLFYRGEQAEDTAIKYMKLNGMLIKEQILLNKHGVIGVLDALISTERLGLSQKIGNTLPVEIKSVKNAKLNRIKKTGIDWHYKLQAGFYAMALNSKYFGVLIISAEDYRHTLYVFETNIIEREVLEIIDKYNKAVQDFEKKGILPKLKTKKGYEWVTNPKYCMFEKRFMEMSDKDLATFMKMSRTRIDGLSGKEEFLAVKGGDK